MKSKKLTILALAASTTVTILGLAGNLQAATVIIVDATTKNGSFETPVVTANGGAWDGGVPSPWSYSGAAFTQRTGGVTPQDGSQYVGLDWWQATSSVSMSHTDVGVTILANTTYTMTAWVRTQNATNAGDPIVGNISIYGWTSGGNQQQATTSLTGLSDTWQQFTATFTTGASGGAVGSALEFSLNKESGGTGTQQKLLFDNVVVTSVPEPSAALLGALGMLCLLRRRR
jgi:hypothetical protein